MCSRIGTVPRKVWNLSQADEFVKIWRRFRSLKCKMHHKAAGKLKQTFMKSFNSRPEIDSGEIDEKNAGNYGNSVSLTWKCRSLLM